MQTLGGLTAIGGSVAVLLNSLPLQELDLMRWGIAVARKGGPWQAGTHVSLRRQRT